MREREGRRGGGREREGRRGGGGEKGYWSEEEDMSAFALVMRSVRGGDGRAKREGFCVMMTQDGGGGGMSP
jgi:hypothetical protein